MSDSTPVKIESNPNPAEEIKQENEEQVIVEDPIYIQVVQSQLGFKESSQHSGSFKREECDSEIQDQRSQI